MNRATHLVLNTSTQPGAAGAANVQTSLKKYVLSFSLALFMLSFACAQDSSNVFTDSINPINNTAVFLLQSKLPFEDKNQSQVRRRIRFVATTNAVLYGVGMAGLYQTWYKHYPQSKFHTFNDLREWKQMDKVGHMYSAYAESKASMELWRWTGISRKKRIWLGGMSGAAYQTVIEILDGFSAEWGWSWGDFAANIAGSGMLVAQELAWDEQRIQMKWSFHRKRYTDDGLNKRSDELFGKSNAERFLKDYNGQTYWLSVAPKAFFPDSKFPPWLQVSLGTGTEGLFGGYENTAKDENGVIQFNRTDIARRRQWYLAPDIDLTKIKTNKKGIKVALQILNIFKFPTPSLEYSKGRFNWNWFHF